MSAGRFRRFSVFVLAFTLAVILWGAYVRASGSGAGCGSHWPTCNGEIIPRPRSLATVIEFTHRGTSGIAFMLVLAQLIWALRAFARRHPVRQVAAAAMALMVTEALVGAGLVLFEMVAGNKSLARALWMEAHLLNTFALLGAQTLLCWFSGVAFLSRAPSPSPPWSREATLISLGLVGVLLVALSGAVAALGDTLFPATSLTSGMQDDLSPTAHLFVRLRVWHPILAVLLGVGLLTLTGSMVVRDRPAGARWLATAIAGLVLAQLAVGLLNLILLAPIPLQLVHLLLADLIWIGLVTLVARVRMTYDDPSEAVTSAPASSSTRSR